MMMTRILPLLYLFDGSHCTARILKGKEGVPAAFVRSIPRAQRRHPAQHRTTFSSSLHLAAVDIDENTMSITNEYKMLINGQMVGSVQSYGVINPAKGVEFARAPHASEEQATE